MTIEPFHSVLFRNAEDSARAATSETPLFFGDLNLDQIVDAITLGKQEYSLKPFYHAPLRDLDAIAYRHEVMRDLENQALYESITAFAQRLRGMRAHLAQADKMYYPRQKESWFLDAV